MTPAGNDFSDFSVNQLKAYQISRSLNSIPLLKKNIVNDQRFGGG